MTTTARQMTLFDARPAQQSRLRAAWLRLDDAFTSPSRSTNGDGLRILPGRDVAADVLWRQRGIVAGTVGPEAIGTVDVALVSLTSPMDVYALIKTLAVRGLTADTCGATVVVGGQGALNLRAAAPYFHYAVLGRCEATLAALIDHIEHGRPRNLPASVIDRRRLRLAADSYEIAQASGPYPHAVGGWAETMLGCPHRCSFCQYSHVRVRQTAKYADSGLVPQSPEVLLADIDWSRARRYTAALDGVSQRIRRALRKPASGRTLARALRSMRASRWDTASLKLYLIVGVPTETEDERAAVISEMAGCLAVDGGTTAHVVLATTPLSPDPFTPMQYEGLDTSRDWRWLHRERVYDDGGVVARGDGWTIHAGDIGAISTWQQVRRTLIARGTEDDGDIVRSIAVAEEPWRRLRAQESVEHFMAAYPRALRIVGRRSVGDRAEWGYIRAPRGWDYVDREAARVRRMLGAEP